MSIGNSVTKARFSVEVFEDQEVNGKVRAILRFLARGDDDKLLNWNRYFAVEEEWPGESREARVGRLLANVSQSRDIVLALSRGAIMEDAE